MTPPEIINYLGQSGYRVGLTRPDQVTVTPEPSAKIAKRLTALNTDLVSYLAALPYPPASGHAYYALASLPTLDSAKSGVCIACGVPWAMHGEPVIASWVLVRDPKRIELIVCSPIETEAQVAA